MTVSDELYKKLLRKFGACAYSVYMYQAPLLVLLKKGPGDESNTVYMYETGASMEV